MPLDGRKGEDHDEMAASHGHGKDREASASGHAHGGGKPHRGRRCKPSNDVLPNEDDAAADEPDTRDDLGGNAGRIEDDAARLKYVGKTVFGDEHDQRGRKSDERIGAQTGALLAYLALKPDYRGQHEGKSKFGQLNPALAERFSKEQVTRHLG